MVKKRAEFTVETRSAGQGEVLVYVEDPAGHQEEVGSSRWQRGAGPLLGAGTHVLLPATGKGDSQ